MGKILYFVNGQPTAKDRKLAEAAGAMFRNAAAWHTGDFIEDCDAVMGNMADVPPPYRHLLMDVKPKKAKRANPDVSEKTTD